MAHHQAAVGYNVAMATTQANDDVLGAFGRCRDITEKVDVLIFGLACLGSGTLAKQLNDFQDQRIADQEGQTSEFGATPAPSDTTPQAEHSNA